MPWVDEHYKWGEFAEERQYIASMIEKWNLSDRVIVISGDAHMLAVDDGTHSAGGIKVFQAAALDAKPTSKGGPFSHGIWPGRNQYGTMTIKDMGTFICFVFQGWKWQKDKVLSRLVQFNTCNLTENIPMLYTPSPFVIQKVWKLLKQMLLEESGWNCARLFVVYIDSSRSSLVMVLSTPNFVLLLFALPLVISCIRFVGSMIFRR